MSGLVPPPPPAGLLAGRYRLLDPVGSGGMSTVYRAWDEQRQVFRAVKILERRVADNPRVRQRLLDEAHIMARLQHEHVVTLYEAGADGQRLYLVMELMTGGSVQDRLADGPIPPRMAVGVIAGVLSALQLAHDNGVVHRDVKPHNILLDAQGVPKVTDFGIARLQDGGLTRTGMVLGTLAYMPPEQKLSARKVDPRADLYSTGATLYAMVTGREPHDLYAAGLDAQIGDELFDGVPAELAGLIRQATAFRPEDRYASAQVMAAALAAAAARLPPDPPSRPLVSLERLAESRAAARLGPTLLGVTESAEVTDRVQWLPTLSSVGASGGSTASDPAPAPPPTRWPWVVALGLTAFGGVAWGVSALRIDPPPAPVPDPPAVEAPAPAPRPVASSGPLLDTATEVDEGGVVSGRPRARPLPPPAPSAPPSAVERHGRWEVQRVPGSSPNRASVSATLPANGSVWGPGGVETQPLLLVMCGASGDRVVLRSGLPGFPADKLEVTLSLDDRREALRGIAHETIPGALGLPRLRPREVLAADRLELTYPTSPTQSGTARFDLDAASVRSVFDGVCK